MNRRGFLTGLLAAPALIAGSRLEFGVPRLILPPESGLRRVDYSVFAEPFEREMVWADGARVWVRHRGAGRTWTAWMETRA